MSGPGLRRLTLADPPERWARLGFCVDEGRIELGGIELVLGASGRGIVGWAIAGLDRPLEFDGLGAEPADVTPGQSPAHPNGAIGIDHVVLLSPDFEHTAVELERAGLALRRVVEGRRGQRQGFRRLGPAILELVHAPGAERTYLWGLTVIVEDIDGLAQRLADDLGEVKPAVQPGRRIATLAPSAGLGTAVAFMDPPATSP